MVFSGRDEDVSVTIGGDASSYNQAVDGAIQATNRFNSKVKTLTTILAGGGAVAGLGVAAAMGKAADSASNFESSMADVAKVTSTAVASDLQDDLMELSEEIPVSRKRLTKLAEQAGKFGVEGEENITQFVETTGKMSTAMESVPANQLGKRMAKIAGATDTPISQISKLGNATNALADSMETDADEITDTATRAGITLSNRLGLASDQVLSLSAAMNEVSPSSRLAASALEQMTRALTDPKRVEEVAGALGMSVEKFEAMREESPEELMNRVASTLAKGGEESDALSTALSSRQVQAFNKLGEATESASAAQETVNKQFQEGTSLQRELELRTDSLEGQMQLLRDEINNVATKLGEQLLPFIKDGVSAVSDLTDEVEELIENVDLEQRLSNVIETFSALEETVSSLVEDSGVMSTASAMITDVRDAIKDLGEGDVSGAFDGLVTAAEDADDATRNVLVGESGSSGLTATVGSAIRDAQQWLRNTGSRIIVQGFAALGRAVIGRVQTLSNVLVGPDGGSGVLTEAVDNAVVFIRNTAPELIGSAFEVIGRGIRAAITDITNPLRGKDSVFWDLLADAATWLIKNVPRLFVAVGVGIVKAIIEGVTGLFEGLVGNSALRDPIEKAGAWLVNNMGRLLGGVGTAIVSTIINGLTGMMKSLKNTADTVVEKISDPLSELASWLTDGWGFASKLLGTITGAISKAKDRLGEFASDAKAVLSSLGNGSGSNGRTGLPSTPTGVPVDVPSAQTGGLVEQSGLVAVHRGETIVPADVSQGRGTGQLNPRAIARELSRALNGMGVVVRAGDETLDRVIDDRAEIVVEKRIKEEGRRVRRRRGNQ